MIANMSITIWSNIVVSGDNSAKKGPQLSLIEESYVSKESEKQSRSR